MSITFRFYIAHCFITNRNLTCARALAFAAARSESLSSRDYCRFQSPGIYAIIIIAKSLLISSYVYTHISTITVSVRFKTLRTIPIIVREFVKCFARHLSTPKKRSRTIIEDSRCIIYFPDVKKARRLIRRVQLSDISASQGH